MKKDASIGGMETGDWGAGDWEPYVTFFNNYTISH